MRSENPIGGFILVVIIVGALLYLFIKESGILTRKRLLNKEDAQPGAVVEKIEPVIFGSKRTKHYEIQVTFSDGTTYRDKCNKTTPGYMQYTIQLDKDGIQPVVEAAIAAHDQAVAGK